MTMELGILGVPMELSMLGTMAGLTVKLGMPGMMCWAHQG